MKGSGDNLLLPGFNFGVLLFSPPHGLISSVQVLPPESADFLPRPFKDLMVNPASKVGEFYPNDFKVDFNGKKNAWEAVVLIPFIDEKRLLKAVHDIEATSITAEELKRNKLGKYCTRLSPSLSLFA